MKYTVSILAICFLSFILIFNGCGSDVEESIAPNEIPETITSENSQTQNENLSEYFSINIIGNGTYQRNGAPYPPLEYDIELIS